MELDLVLHNADEQQLQTLLPRNVLGTRPRELHIVVAEELDNVGHSLQLRLALDSDPLLLQAGIQSAVLLLQPRQVALLLPSPLSQTKSQVVAAERTAKIVVVILERAPLVGGAAGRMNALHEFKQDGVHVNVFVWSHTKHLLFVREGESVQAQTFLQNFLEAKFGPVLTVDGNILRVHAELVQNEGRS